jgi:GNAT superfamily N-acetyltransferase
MRIEQFDAGTDGNRLRSCYDIVTAGQRLDDPGTPVRSFTSFTNRWGRHLSGDPVQTWLAVEDTGQPVGCHLMTLPERANPTLAMCTLAVIPARRRSGIGSALLAHCAGQALAAGRVRLAGEAKDGSPGAAFAAAAGARSGIAEAYRHLDIDSGLLARLPSLRAEAEQRTSGYELVTWIGAIPEEFLEDQSRLSAAMADAPLDEGVEAEVWDAERIRRVERICLENGQQFYSVAARHQKTGRLAGITQIFTDAGTPDWAFQMDTAVLADHRGHRLGLLVKVAMLELLTEHEPAVRHIVTGNAGSNQHMIAINEQLGFRVSAVYRNWELDLTGAKSDSRGPAAADVMPL